MALAQPPARGPKRSHSSCVSLLLCAILAVGGYIAGSRHAAAGDCGLAQAGVASAVAAAAAAATGATAGAADDAASGAAAHDAPAAAVAPPKRKVSPATTESPGLTIRETCDAEQSEALATQLLALKAADNLWTSCPANDWMDALEELLRGQAAYRFVDVGCNKGYTSADFFAKWAPELGLNPQSLHEALPDKHCGYCEDCKTRVAPGATPPEGTSHPEVHVVCVEPNQLAFGQLISMRQRWFGGNHAWAQWHMVNAALGGDKPWVAFPRCLENREECAFGLANNIVAGVDTVPVLSVDALLDTVFGWDHVDILKLDCEGYDVPAIKSGLGSLSGGKVGVLLFEYNIGGAWASNSLEATVAFLDELDFVCYLSGKNATNQGSLLRLTGCWNARMDLKHWSNVVCMGRGHPLYPRAERMSLRYAMFRNAYSET